MPGNRPVNRRNFFREGLRELLRPLAGAVEPFEEVMRQLSKMEHAASPPAPLPPPPPSPAVASGAWLRPPGALPETSFRDTCSRCGNCVKACPAQCIKIDEMCVQGYGAPYIDPDVMSCVVCDGLVCMRDCPSGALAPTALGLIDMGTAFWNEEMCVRTTGDDCRICIEKCPIGTIAIELFDGRVRVNEEGCIGCGVCQNCCPTQPKSIVVMPSSSR